MIRRSLLFLLLACPAFAVTPLDLATSNAMERILAGAREHPLVVVLAGDDVATGEKDIRKAMVEGLTPAQAADIKAGLDTAPERARVLALLRTVASDADIVLALRWVRAEVLRAGSVVGPVQPGTPPTGPPWQTRLGRQMLTFAAPNYYFASQTDADRILNAILAAGLDGPLIELGGPFIVDAWNGKPTTRTIEDIYREQIDAWARWDEGIRKRGLVAQIAFLNSNQSLANKITDAQWQSIAKDFAVRYGSENKIILPLSETDSRTRPGVGDAIYKGLLAGGFPRSQIIGYGANRWGDYTEVHKGRGSVPTGNRRLSVVNDNGPDIADIYGSKWSHGGTPNLGRIEEFARELRRKGVSGGVYSFGKVFDYEGCAAAGKGWGGQITTPTTGARIVKVRDAGGEHISVTVEGWNGWPSKTWGNGKTTYARLMIATPTQPNGVYVDAMTGGQMSGSRKTLGNAFGIGSHSLDVHRGETVQVWVSSYDGRESNRVDWVWPYRST